MNCKRITNKQLRDMRWRISDTQFDRLNDCHCDRIPELQQENERLDEKLRTREHSRIHENLCYEREIEQLREETKMLRKELDGNYCPKCGITPCQCKSEPKTITR